jgi:hypothetical protein
MIESGLVIFFPVVRSTSTVRLCGESWNSAAFSCDSIGIVFPSLAVRSSL